MVSIGKWLLYGLVGAFAISALVDPARAQGTIGAFSGVGTAGEEWYGWARYGLVRQARQGEVGRCRAWQGKARYGRTGVVHD